MDILLAGTLFSSLMEFSLPGNCPASPRPTAIRLWKTFRSKLNTIPVAEQNCSPSHRNCVHLQTGMLFGITTEWRSASHRNRVHLRPDSPLSCAVRTKPSLTWSMGARRVVWSLHSRLLWLLRPVWRDSYVHCISCRGN